MVGPWPPTKGGVTTFMRNVVNSQLKEKYDFIAFTTSRPGKRNVRQDNYGYAAVFRGGIKRVAQGVFITLWHLLIYPWTVLLRRPDVIQIQASDFQAFWESALYVLMGKALLRPVVLRIGGSFDRFYGASGPIARAGIRWTLRQASVLVVQSQYWKNYVDRSCHAERVVIVNNFVPATLVKQRPLPGPSIPRFLLCAGEVPQLKGAYVLLDALRVLKARGVRASVTIMAVTQALRDRIIELGLEKYVVMLDFLSHDDALRAFRDADIFLQISSSEGFPNALLEAMALGCAAIVTPVGAVPDIVGSEGECAYVVTVGDERGLAACMEHLGRDQETLKRMAHAAQRRVLAHFTEHKVTPMLDHAWQFAMRRHGVRWWMSRERRT